VYSRVRSTYLISDLENSDSNEEEGNSMKADGAKDDAEFVGALPAADGALGAAGALPIVAIAVGAFPVGALSVGAAPVPVGTLPDPCVGVSPVGAAVGGAATGGAAGGSTGGRAGAGIASKVNQVVLLKEDTPAAHV
jgi:hypothetical protein